MGFYETLLEFWMSESSSNSEQTELRGNLPLRERFPRRRFVSERRKHSFNNNKVNVLEEMSELLERIRTRCSIPDFQSHGQWHGNDKESLTKTLFIPGKFEPHVGTGERFPNREAKADAAAAAAAALC